jgi:hypothetical protein
MLKILFVFLLVVHGLIHGMGFVKAFDWFPITTLHRNIGKFEGVVWMLTALLFIAAAVMYFIDNKSWLIIGVIALILSQLLIVINWNEAKFGTILNVLVLVMLVLQYSAASFKSGFNEDVKRELAAGANEVVKKNSIHDLQHLPYPVQQYMIQSGFLEQEEIRNFRVEFKGRIRASATSEWMEFTTVQYSFTEHPARYFFMEAKMYGLPVAGYHAYSKGKAMMDIRLLSLLQVQYQDGELMDISETVTFFNDVCLMAPAALVDKRIQWKSVSNNEVEAAFTHEKKSISARLIFSEDFKLINFITNDRYYFSGKEMKKVQWETPVRAYDKAKRFLQMERGDAVWKLQDGDFCYGEFTVMDIKYNVSSME